MKIPVRSAVTKHTRWWVLSQICGLGPLVKIHSAQREPVTPIHPPRLQGVELHGSAPGGWPSGRRLSPGLKYFGGSPGSYFFMYFVSPDVPCDAVESSNEHSVKTMPPSICHQLVETRSLRLCSGNCVRVLMHDFVSALFRHFAEVEQLCFQMLVSSAHARVNSSSFLHFNSFFLKSKYASMARRTSSATGAPVFLDSF